MAKAKLTRDLVRRFRVSEGRKEAWLWDDIVPGLAVRALPSGKRTYVLQIRDGQKILRRALGSADALALEQAREAARQQIGELSLRRSLERLGVKAPQLAEERLTLEQAAERWLTDPKTKLKASTLVECRRHLNLHLTPLLTREIIRIQRKEVRDLLNAIAKRGHTVNANRVRATLSAIINWALSNDFLEKSPLTNIPPFGETARSRTLSIAEIGKLWHVTGTGSAGDDLTRLLMLTALRRSEAGGIHDNEIDDANQSVVIPAGRMKNGVAFACPLSDRAWSIIEERRGRGYLFGADGNAPFKGWSRLLGSLRSKASFKEAWVLHDFRRSFSTQASDAALAWDNVIDKQLAHGKGGVAGIYNRAELFRPRADLVEKWTALVLRAGEAASDQARSPAASVGRGSPPEPTQPRSRAVDRHSK